MKTVNSLSGGKTSSYLAVHYPADYELFSLCCIDSHNACRKIDKKIKQMVNDKLQKHCPHYPEFVATSEDPIILNTIFDLEQMLGRDIIWLRGFSWEQMLAVKKTRRNHLQRLIKSHKKSSPSKKLLCYPKF